MDLIVKPFSVTVGRADATGPQFKLSVPELGLTSGGVTFVLGRNGSGKSLMLRGLAGTVDVEPPGPTVTTSGGEPLRGSLRPSLVHQRCDDNLALSLTLVENLVLRRPPPSLLAGALGVSSADRRWAAELVRDYGSLPNRLDVLVGELSLGQRQVLAFLAATATRTPLLLLDEFFSAADLGVRDELLRRAVRHAEACESVVVVVSHDIGVAMRWAREIILVRDGTIAAMVCPGEEMWNEAALAKFLTA